MDKISINATTMFIINSSDEMLNSHGEPSSTTPLMLLVTLTNLPEPNIDTIDDAIYWKDPDEMLIPWIMNPYFFPIIVTYVITFIIGVTGNATVIWIMAGDRTSRRYRSYA